MIAALLFAAAAAVAVAHHPVSTSSAQAQAAFDDGLTALYAYNRRAAQADFAAALKADPHLAIAAWGLALANGTDLNTPLTAPRFARAQDAAKSALALEQYASAEERSLIEAVASRYGGTYGDRERDEVRYRSLMAQVVQRYPGDDDAAMVDAEALIEADSDDLAPIRRLISTVLQRNPNHLMANHLCIHAYDDARDGTPALPCADRLAAMALPPQAEHLAHMPAHSYIETGAYAKAVIASDRAYAMPHTDYAAHDAYVGWNAAMMMGDEALARRWGARVAAETGEGTQLATLARFGRWREIVSQPWKDQLYQPFALGMAYIHTGNAIAARAQAALISAKHAQDTGDLLRAKIAEQSGALGAAEAALRDAVTFQKDNYSGETLPLFPAGEALGALYYRAGRFSEARTAFEETLARYPDDPRALYGLALTLGRLGSAAQANRVLKSFDAQWTEPPLTIDDM